MIKIKLKLIEKESNSFDIDIISDEKLSSAIHRSLDGIVTKDQKPEEHFVVVVNGMVVKSDFWDVVKLKKDDSVLIAPKIKGGGDGLLRTFLLVATSLIVGPWAIAQFGQGVVAGLVTAGAVTLVGSLIPPPVPPGLEEGGLESQMYTISGQSNGTRKYDTVPKVYGVHRIFPPFAAAPYTELEADQNTGGLIQYFYGLYDLGLGPVIVENIQIGDTPVSDYSDVSVRLVDFNKPAVSEGVWDDATSDRLEYYKGDVNRSTVSVAMNTDENPSSPEEDYTTIRNATPNTGGYAQEIAINLAGPAGLFSFNSNGEQGSRTVDLDIEFSKVGEDNWFGWNDLTKVSSFKGVGGDAEYNNKNINLKAPTSNPPAAGYSLISQNAKFIGVSEGGSADYVQVKNYGLLKGTNQISLQDPDGSLIGQILRIRGINVGQVTAESAPSGGNILYTFETPLPTDVILFTLPADTPYEDIAVSGKVTREGYTRARARITYSDRGAVYADFKFTPVEVASYKVRITRRRSFSTPSNYTSTIQDGITWLSLTTRFDVDPIKTTKRHTFLEIKVRATDQLNGNIQNLSAICSSVLDVYDPDTETWSKQFTNNPAWVFVDLLTGEVNKRAISKDRLDLESILDWADFCEEVPTAPPGGFFGLPRFQSNFILDFNPTLQTAINMVTNAAQASLNIIDGKYGILIDRLRTVPVQLFTPRNSSNFSSTKNYADKPDGLKITYVDPSANWEEREAIVYDNGFDEETAIKYEEVKSFGCTNHEQAWRLGRYMLAQNRLRQETITIQVDFENLVCTRGDYVQIVQPVMKVGGTAARVKSLVGSTIVIDEGIETDNDLDYGYVLRKKTGEIITDTLTVVSADTYTLDGDLPQVGDLVVIGVINSIVFDCLVKSIDPQDDLKATIVLVEKADAIYSAESTDTLPDYSPQISATSGEFSPPEEVVDLEITDNFFECDAGGPALNYFVTLDWDVPTNAAFELFEIYLNIGRGYNLIDTTKESIYTYQASRSDFGLEHKFKVLAVSATGRKLQLGQVGEVSATVDAKTTPPSNIETFNSDITGEVLQLFWTQVSDCSCKEYLIRFSPAVNGTATWERSIPLARVDRNTTSVAVQARAGTYFIKAVDYEDNESLAATAIATTIPQIFNLNIIEETNDFPALPGVFDRVVSETGGLTLDNTIVGGVDTAEYYSEGFYYYANILDLGDIFTVRLQSLIEAEGFTLEDLMANWPTLAEMDTLSHAGNSDWDVETYYRTTDRYNVMAEWPSLSDIDPISEGFQEIWTEWRKFTMGDATGRKFQFRLRLISNKVSVTPRVFDGKIRADMPDREDVFSDLSAPVEGLAVTYDPAFYGPGTSPFIGISMQSAQSGDYWTFDYRNLEGFFIRFFDVNDNPVARSFDATVRGHGRRATAVI